jgi:Ca-activated chloride channel family protein
MSSIVSSPLAISTALAVAALVLVLLAEKLHYRRICQAARLALGPSGEVRRWIRLVGYVRALCLAGMVWSLAILYVHRGGIFRDSVGTAEDDNARRVVFLADLSPSMHLRDAGPSGKQLRIERMHEVVEAVLQRIEGQVLLTVICFYTDALPAIVDARDSELVRNIFAGLPVWYVMESGKTDLGHGVREALQLLREHPPQSITLFVCTDGDCVPVGPIPASPAAIRDTYVLGVGDPDRGQFIDDHLSRQDAVVLSSLAGRLGGQYLDVNTKHVPTYSLGSLVAGEGGSARRWTLVDLAVSLFAMSAAVLAALPVALSLFGSDWRVVRPPHSPATAARQRLDPERVVS